MALLTIQRPTLAGTAITYAAAAEAGDEFPNDGRVRLSVRNANESAVTVTVASPGTCNQGGTHAVEVTVPAGGERLIGPFARDRFNAQDGNVDVGYSAHEDVTVAVIA